MKKYLFFFLADINIFEPIKKFDSYNTYDIHLFGYFVNMKTGFEVLLGVAPILSR